MKLYRGTRYEGVKGHQKVTSWTPSLAVAVIYSATSPGDAFSIRQDPEFLETSTVHTAELRDGAKVLNLCGGKNTCTFSTMMKELRFGEPDGMTQEEGEKIIRVLHRRYLREVGWSGGPFKYIVFQEEQPDEPMDPEDEENVPFSPSDPQTLLSSEVMGEFEYRPWEIAGRFVIETFALADSSTLRNVARRLGYEALTYEDVFYGGERGGPALLGCKVGELEGVKEGWGVDSAVPLHTTFRPLNKDVLVDRHSVPTEEVLPEVQCAAPAANPRRPNPAPSNVDLARRLRF